MVFRSVGLASQPNEKPNQNFGSVRGTVVSWCANRTKSTFPGTLVRFVKRSTVRFWFGKIARLPIRNHPYHASFHVRFLDPFPCYVGKLLNTTPSTTLCYLLSVVTGFYQNKQVVHLFLVAHLRTFPRSRGQKSARSNSHIHYILYLGTCYTFRWHHKFQEEELQSDYDSV